MNHSIRLSQDLAASWLLSIEVIPKESKGEREGEKRRERKGERGRGKETHRERERENMLKTEVTVF